MRPFRSTVSLAEARRLLAEAMQPIARTERVALANGAGRVAAADITSAIDVPPFARSAMDGYAVVSSDTQGATDDAPRRLQILERLYTSQLPRLRVAPGACAEIATGAPVPDGADAVVMAEETRQVDSHRVDVLVPARAGQNIGRRGADITAGQVVVRCGETLTPSRVGAVAAIGWAEVDVYLQPRVAVLSTGNEVVEPGAPLGDGQIYDVNRFTLASLIADNGGIPDPRPPARDALDELIAALDACAGADLIVFSGGSSVGERDLVVDLVAARGEMIFHGIAIKPGKPTAFARLGGTPFFGMPGNPTSCLSNAYVFLVPFLRATARLQVREPRTVRVPLRQRIVSAPGRHQFYTVRVVDGAAFPAFKGSGEITSLSQADGYIEIPEEQSVVAEGTVVEVKLF